MVKPEQLIFSDQFIHGPDHALHERPVSQIGHHEGIIMG